MGKDLRIRQMRTGIQADLRRPDRAILDPRHGNDRRTAVIMVFLKEDIRRALMPEQERIRIDAAPRRGDEAKTCQIHRVG